jgi:hypothetical protein
MCGTHPRLHTLDYFEFRSVKIESESPLDEVKILALAARGEDRDFHEIAGVFVPNHFHGASKPPFLYQLSQMNFRIQ